MILVTGGAGYIGSNMALKLIDNGFDIVIFDNLEIGHSEVVDIIKKSNSKGKLVEFFKGDLKNKSDIEKVFDKYKIDAVLHFAAYALVGESVYNPKKYWHNNVYGTLNLLDTMIENGTKKIVFSSTAATYGEPEYTPIDENHIQKPINPYGMTKLAAEKIMDDYDRAYGLKSVRLRYFNVAGADYKLRVGEWHDVETHIIPNIVKSANEKNKVFQVFGDTYNTKDGSCVRDYVNVDDLTDAHLLALEYLNNGGKTDYFNLGTKEGNSVIEVFNCAKEVIGKEIQFEIQDKREGDPAILVADNKKAEEILGFKPKRNLKYSIETAFLWEQKRVDLFSTTNV